MLSNEIIFRYKFIWAVAFNDFDNNNQKDHITAQSISVDNIFHEPGVVDVTSCIAFALGLV